MYSMEATYQNRNLFYKMKNNHGITQWKSSHCAQKKNAKKIERISLRTVSAVYSVVDYLIGAWNKIHAKIVYLFFGGGGAG